MRNSKSLNMIRCNLSSYGKNANPEFGGNYLGFFYFIRNFKRMKLIRDILRING